MSRECKQGFTLLEVALAVLIGTLVLIPLMYAFNRMSNTFRVGSLELRMPAAGGEALEEITRTIRYADRIVFAPTPNYPPANWQTMASSEDSWPRFACHIPNHPSQPAATRNKWIMYRYNLTDGSLETKTAATNTLNTHSDWNGSIFHSLKGLLANHTVDMTAASYPVPFRFTNGSGDAMTTNLGQKDCRRIEITLLLSSGDAPPLLLRTSVAPRNIPHF